ncbi:hypothetical protein D3C80_1544820 [compost metagenome]
MDESDWIALVLQISIEHSTMWSNDDHHSYAYSCHLDYYCSRYQHCWYHHVHYHHSLDSYHLPIMIVMIMMIVMMIMMPWVVEQSREFE